MTAWDVHPAGVPTKVICSAGNFSGHSIVTVDPEAFALDERYTFPVTHFGRPL